MTNAHYGLNIFQTLHAKGRLASSIFGNIDLFQDPGREAGVWN